MFTIKNVSATTPRVFHLSFDKQGQSDIAKVAKESISLPAGFPKDKFLVLFEEWKLARNNPDPTNGGNDRSKYFAQLRDMHQQYGINAGSLRNADEDMLLFGEYVKTGVGITTNTQAETRAIIAPAVAASPKSIDISPTHPDTLSYDAGNIVIKKGSRLVPFTGAIGEPGMKDITLQIGGKDLTGSYIGSVKDGKFDGKGILTTSDGKTRNGEWKNGSFILTPIVAPAVSSPIVAPARSSSPDLKENTDNKFLEFQKAMADVTILYNGIPQYTKKFDKIGQELFIQIAPTPKSTADIYFEKRGDRYELSTKTKDNYTVVETSPDGKRAISLSPKVSSQNTVPATPSVAPAAPARSLGSAGVAPTAPVLETKPEKTPAEIMAAKIAERDKRNEKNITKYNGELTTISSGLDENEIGGEDGDGVDEKTLKTLITALLSAKPGEDRSQAVLKLQTELSSYNGMEKLARDGWLGEATMKALKKVVETVPDAGEDAPAPSDRKEEPKKEEPKKDASAPTKTPEVPNEVTKEALDSWKSKLGDDIVWHNSKADNTPAKIGNVVIQGYINLEVGDAKYASYTILGSTIYTLTSDGKNWEPTTILEIRNGKIEKKTVGTPSPATPVAPTKAAEKTPGKVEIEYAEGMDEVARNKARETYKKWIDGPITLEGAPKGVKVEKIKFSAKDEAGIYFTGIKEGDIAIADGSKNPYLISDEREIYDISIAKADTPQVKFEKSKAGEELIKKYPGFFPTSKVQILGNIAQLDIEKKNTDVSMEGERLYLFIKIPPAQTIQLFSDTDISKPITVFHGLREYEVTVDPIKGTLTFKQLIEEAKLQELAKAFNIDIDAGMITKVEDKRNVKTKAANIGVTAGQDGLGTFIGFNAINGVGMRASGIGMSLNDKHNNREFLYKYDKATQTLTLEDSPRQKMVDNISKVGLIKAKPDEKNITQISISNDGGQSFFSVSLPQAKILEKYYYQDTKIPKHIGFLSGKDRSEYGILLKGVSKDQNGNLILADGHNNPGNNNEFTLIISPDGQTIVPIIKRNGYGHATRDLLGLGGPTDAQKQLIEDIKKTARE